jgi:hypothetical protein
MARRVAFIVPELGADGVPRMRHFYAALPEKDPRQISQPLQTCCTTTSSNRWSSGDRRRFADQHEEKLEAYW